MVLATETTRAATRENDRDGIDEWFLLFSFYIFLRSICFGCVYTYFWTFFFVLSAHPCMHDTLYKMLFSNHIWTRRT
jgi:hypothetical protein